ncbi:SAM-dependent methyltransferase [Sutterella sp.]|uniref:SAM-dependent methyltransferase n=1 Tax=Sutterella sp. TaxID=1981025 RepID=UPI0026E0E9B4|nr:SAM-dependent methyltransferase [Sutterella sp.]MDO5532832.1 SAM-dependent methyltransferase [Sutterella sp.]
MSGTLYLLPCPISERPPEETLPAHTLEVARSLGRFYAEAAKTARATLKSFGHPKPIASLVIEEIGHDPDEAKIDGWLAPVLAGEDAGIISESGCPGIADPGAQIAARAHELGLRVVPLTGPSSLLLALMASGLDGQRFRFLGYLPIADAERREALLAAEAQSRASETQLAIETPYRNSGLLAAMLETLAPSTRLTVAWDITGADETIRTLTVEKWRALPEAARTLPKLPCVFAFLAAPGRTAAPRYAPQHAQKKGAAPKASVASAPRHGRGAPRPRGGKGGHR